MAGYFIGEVAVTDPELFEAYRPLASATIAKHGGTYLARGAEPVVLEGAAPSGRVVILRFDTLDALKGWYHSDDYAGPLAMRKRSATSRIYVVEGEDLPSLAGAGYYVGERDVHDDAAYADYVSKAGPTIGQYDGQYMIKGAKWEVLEGDAPMPRVIVLRFPSVARCQEWFTSDDYHPAHDIRERAATSRTYIVEGL